MKKELVHPVVQSLTGDLPHRPTGPQWIGLALILLGGTSIFQFAFGASTLEQAIPGFASMGLVAPMLFLASGISCALLGAPHKRVLGPWERNVVHACVVLLAAFPAATLAEHLTGVSLGLDFKGDGVQPTRSNPFPGRMAPNACIAFGLAGMAIQMLLQPATALRRSLVLCFTWGVALIGVIGGIGYVLHLERLYGFGAASRMLLPMACGLTLLSASLWLLRERWLREPGAGIQRHEQWIGRRSVAVLSAVTVAAGVGGFAVVQGAYERSQAVGLLLTATTNADALAHTLEVSAWFPATIATNPAVGHSLDELRSKPNETEHVDRLRRAGLDLLRAGVSGVRFESNTGVVMATAGRLVVKATDPAFALSPGFTGSKLVWNGGYFLYSQQLVSARGQEVGRITTEQPLPLFDKLVANIRGANDSSDALVCNRVDDFASCAPSRFYAAPFKVPMLDANGEPDFPISRALLGHAGVLMTTDLRGIPVVAAYTPIASTGLGLVVKADIETAFALLRQRLNILGFLLAGLVAAGWWVLRGQVRPLVAQIADAQREVAAGEKRQQAIADNLPVLIAYINTERKLTFANQTFEQWMGLDPEQLKGKLVDELGTTIYEERPDMLALALAGHRVEYEAVSDMRSVVRNLHTVLVPDVQAGGQIVGIYALSTDVTASKAAEQHQHQLAQVDALTGLPNRRQFEERLGQAMARSGRSKRPMALIFMDIDHFKAINDSLGHAAGDDVLKEFGARLRGAIRVTDLAARLAGDEFVAILEGVNAVEEASLVAGKLLEAIRQPICKAGRTMMVTASIGVAYYNGSGDSPESLLERADRELYRAKDAGRNTFATSVF